MDLLTHPLKDLSVLVTCYNKINSLDGFLNQAKELIKLGCELIVVDDGSCDGSTQTLKDGLQGLANCKFIQQINQGSAAARNNAVANATRKYLQFLDIDDFLNISLLSDIFRGAYLNDDALSIFEISRVTSPEFPLHPSTLFSRELEKLEAQALLVSSLGYSRIIYPRKIVDTHKLKFVPTFASLGGERFILDDFFWIIHIASLNFKCIKFDDNLILYGYVKPENASADSGRDFANQASLFPKATSVFVKALPQCQHQHDAEFLNQSVKSSNKFHLKFVQTAQMLGVIRFIINPRNSLSVYQSYSRKHFFRLDLLGSAVIIFCKETIRQALFKHAATKRVWTVLSFLKGKARIKNKNSNNI